jgi:hypothetical protein
MADTDRTLVGAWVRTTDDPCAAQYAAHLRFEPNGLYFGTTEPPGGFTWWDGGTWRIAAPGRLSLATANDAVVTYDYTAMGDRLTITDASGCQVTYRRA